MASNSTITSTSSNEQISVQSSRSDSVGYPTNVTREITGWKLESSSPAPAPSPSPAPALAAASHFNPSSWKYDPEDRWSVESQMHKWEQEGLALEERLGKRFSLGRVRFARELELLKLCGND